MNPTEQATATRDITFDLVSILYHALQAGETCQQYLQDAQGDQAVSEFIERVIQANRRIAQDAKQILNDRMQSSAQPGESVVPQ